MNIYTRNISVQIQEWDSDSWKAVATMENITDGIDGSERFEIEIVVTKSRFEIITVENIVFNGLHAVCCEVIPKLQEFKGVIIGKGYSKKVIEIAGGKDGCTHIVEMLNEIGRCIYQAHHGVIYRDKGIKECIDEFKSKSNIYCLGVDRYE